MEKNILDFIQKNSPDGGFLQSENWREFQKSVGRKTFVISKEDIYASIIVHRLPIVGDYFYVPRGPVIEAKSEERKAKSYSIKFKTFLGNLIDLAKTNNIAWIRIEPASDELLDLIKENLPGKLKVKKSAVDMQPREILLVDISKSEEEILAGMKQKTRYNIRLSQKKGVKISNIQYPISKKYIDEFLRLIEITSERDRITAHPESYYRKMFEVIPPENLKLYIAEYKEKVIAANLVLFFGRTATYMHGASDNAHREVMAPYLLQWQQIIDAKKAGCEKYDFGGINKNKWPGITRFKTGFAPNTEPTKFPGSYDIILKPWKYNLYRALQKIKRIF